MNEEIYQKLKKFEDRRIPLFTSVLQNKSFGILSRADISILNGIAIQLVNDKLSTCGCCLNRQKIVLTKIANKYFEYERNRK